MARDGSGNYTAPLSDVVVDTTILASWANTTIGDIATALTFSLSKDGQTNPTANLPMNGFKHTGVGAPAVRTDYMRVAEVVDGAWSYLTNVGGTADAITATGPYAVPAYVAGQRWSFVSGGSANTGPVTINVNGIGAKAITKNGANPLAAGDLPAGQLNMIEYDGTQFQLLVPGFYAGDYTPVADVGISFSSGDELIFKGTLPAGWTRSAAYNEHAIKLDDAVSPTDGGTVDFEVAMDDQSISGNTGGHALTEAQMPAHSHSPQGGGSFWANTGSGIATDGAGAAAFLQATSTTTVKGSGQQHSHTISANIDMDIKFHAMNVIVKD